MCQSHTGRLTELWFLPKPAFGLNTNDDDDVLGVALELLNLQLYYIKYYLLVNVKGITWDLTPESDPWGPIFPSHTTFIHTTHTCIMC